MHVTVSVPILSFSNEGNQRIVLLKCKTVIFFISPKLCWAVLPAAQSRTQLTHGVRTIHRRTIHRGLSPDDDFYRQDYSPVTRVLLTRRHWCGPSVSEKISEAKVLNDRVKRAVACSIRPHWDPMYTEPKNVPGGTDVLGKWKFVPGKIRIRASIFTSILLFCINIPFKLIVSDALRIEIKHECIF